jgi:lysophospholipid acyltransferase (LPLAT)-like uncharacterized protein
VTKRPQKSGVVVPHRLRWYEELLAFVIFAIIRLVSATWRLRLVTPIPEAPGPVIFCLWHNRLALCMKVYEQFGQSLWPDRGLTALISASKDGALLARVLKYFKVTAIRGSSSRRGREALLEMTGRLQEGFNAAITPDGPKGPKYRVQEGVIALAQITGASIIPVSMKTRAKFLTRSWDNFQIPKPFARCELYVARPLTVPREASDAERESLRQELQSRLMSITFD